MTPSRPLATVATAAILAAALPVPGAHGQVVRVSGATTIRFVELHPLVSDSVPVADVGGEGLDRRLDDGTLVLCFDGAVHCRFLRTGATRGVLPVVQDIAVSAWGLGRGLRFYGRLRGRAVVTGSERLWPESGDAADLLDGYLEMERDRLRIRAGRQWQATALGYQNYDGLNMRAHATAALSAELTLGRALLRGTAQPLTSDALEAIEPFAPDVGSWLIAGQLRFVPRPGYGVTAVYQREIRDDRLGLTAERFALAAILHRGTRSLDAELEADLATREVNEATLRGSVRPAPGLRLDGFLRRHRPFFELWTIWGAFSAVGFDELGGGTEWRPGGGELVVDASAAYRRYPDSEAGLSFAPLRSDGWRLSIGGSARPAPGWSLAGAYATDVGFGAARGQLDLRVERALPEETTLGAAFTAFQRAYEMRVADGTVYGLALDGRRRLGPRTRAALGLAWYHHRPAANAGGVDWSQLRGSLRLDWTVGAEPVALRRPER